LSIFKITLIKYPAARKTEVEMQKVATVKLTLKLLIIITSLSLYQLHSF